MRFLLDTDICIHLIRHKPAGLLRKLTALPPGEVGVSSITLVTNDVAEFGRVPNLRVENWL